MLKNIFALLMKRCQSKNYSGMSKCTGYPSKKFFTFLSEQADGIDFRNGTIHLYFQLARGIVPFLFIYKQKSQLKKRVKYKHILYDRCVLFMVKISQFYYMYFKIFPKFTNLSVCMNR